MLRELILQLWPSRGGERERERERERETLVFGLKSSLRPMKKVKHNVVRLNSTPLDISMDRYRWV
jgi:hypothetical protein